MIRVTGKTECSETLVETDEWIDFKATWYPRPTGQPIYVRISGSHGGEVELKVEPITGRLIQAIVIVAPPAPPVEIPTPDTTHSTRQAPAIDLTEWDTPEDPTVVHPLRGVVQLTANLDYQRNGNTAVLRLLDTAVAEYVCCGDAWVGLGHDGRLAQIGGTTLVE